MIENIENLAFIYVPNLEILDLANNNIRNFQSLKKCNLKSLKSLMINDNKFVRLDFLKKTQMPKSIQNLSFFSESEILTNTNEMLQSIGIEIQTLMFLTKAPFMQLKNRVNLSRYKNNFVQRVLKNKLQHFIRSPNFDLEEQMVFSVM